MSTWQLLAVAIPAALLITGGLNALWNAFDRWHERSAVDEAYEQAREISRYDALAEFDRNRAKSNGGSS